jgi:hypothetical protein
LEARAAEVMDWIGHRNVGEERKRIGDFGEDEPIGSSLARVSSRRGLRD